MFFERLGEYENENPNDSEVQNMIREWQEYISEHFYKCDNQMLSYLGELYISDERFSDYINRFGNGTLAKFLYDAIKIYCADTSGQVGPKWAIKNKT